MIKNIFKMQPRLQEIADTLVFVHPKVQRQSCGWEVAGNFISDLEHGDWKSSLKYSHQLLANADSVYEINILNNMLDLPVKSIVVNGVSTVIFKSISRRCKEGRPYWRVDRRINGERLSKQFTDVNYNNCWESSLKAATIYLLESLKTYNPVESSIEYPKVSAFLFKTGQIRLCLRTSVKSIASYVNARTLTQQELDLTVTELYREWVWFQTMLSKFDIKHAKSIQRPSKLEHWHRDDFPTLSLDDLLKRVQH